MGRFLWSAIVQSRLLEDGGLVALFERRFSADGVNHHKPCEAARSKYSLRCPIGLTLTTNVLIMF
jgi:hypothetical protein